MGEMKMKSLMSTKVTLPRDCAVKIFCRTLSRILENNRFNYLGRLILPRTSHVKWNGECNRIPVEDRSLTRSGLKVLYVLACGVTFPVT